MRLRSPYDGDGLDDEGHVEGCMQTEQIIRIKDAATAAVQMRGAIPMFWEAGADKIRLTRSPGASAAAFLRFAERIDTQYGRCLPVSLVHTAADEGMLSDAFGTLRTLCAKTLPPDSSFRKMVLHSQQVWAYPPACFVGNLVSIACLLFFLLVTCCLPACLLACVLVYMFAWLVFCIFFGGGRATD